ncbi:hypothetical protein BDV96DRAFT_669763 [Lophiotrema nucula]|uniref:DUF7708 domain-containing protein n=1 Tax=Lophiotrema nucula TaxID=690887 RepID=A0A6A5YPH8_9PLEO|nr:hypothetical protein BDV96DRAFT_669763 [Lophiotrema nucula]
MADHVWENALDRKHDALKRAKIDVTTNITSLGMLEASLVEIADKYTDKTTTTFVRGKLTPHLDNVASFTKAITVCTQSNSCASLVWGSLLMVIEFLDDIMDELADLQNTLSRFAEYLELYQSDPTLQPHLRSLYEDYLDFCICVVKYVHRKPALNMVRNLISSSHIKELSGIKAAICTHRQRFEERAEVAHRREAGQNLMETRNLKQKVTDNQDELVRRISPESNVASRSMSGNTLTLMNSLSSGESPSTSPSHVLVHTITWKRNQLFSGRNQELHLLHDYLSSPK